MAEVEQEHWWYRARRDLLLAILRSCVPRDSRVLDVGCGTGFLTEALAKEWEVWGIDPSAEAVALCRARGLDRVRQASVTDLGTGLIPACAAICFFDVLEHLEDDVQALRCARANLTGAGRLVASVPAYPWLWSRHDVAHHHRRRYTKESLSRTLESAGLVPERAGYFNSRLFPVAMVARLWSRVLGRVAGDSLLEMPPRPLNNVFYSVFASEAARFGGSDPCAFRYGLSVFVVGRKATQLEG